MANLDQLDVSAPIAPDSAIFTILNRLLSGLWRRSIQHQTHIAVIEAQGLQGLADAMRARTADEAVAAAHDATTRNLIEKSLSDEEQHLSWLETEIALYEKLGESLYCASRLSPGAHGLHNSRAGFGDHSIHSAGVLSDVSH